MNNVSKLARIEKLAAEAELISKGGGSPYAVSDWTWKNTAELAAFLRELKTRIEAEEGGGL